MNETLEAQQDAAARMMYAAIGAPVLVGQKARDFGKSVLGELSFDDFETAGRDFTGHLQDSKVVEQLQETMDMEQFQDRVDGLREQLESLLSNWRDQFDATVKTSEKIEVDEPDKAATKKKTTSTAKKASTAKKSTSSSKK